MKSDLISLTEYTQLGYWKSTHYLPNPIKWLESWCMVCCKS